MFKGGRRGRLKVILGECVRDGDGEGSRSFRVNGGRQGRLKVILGECLREGDGEGSSSFWVNV